MLALKRIMGRKQGMESWKELFISPQDDKARAGKADPAIWARSNNPRAN